MELLTVNESFDSVRVVESLQGKPQALSKVVAESEGDYLIFCDADTNT